MLLERFFSDTRTQRRLAELMASANNLISAGANIRSVLTSRRDLNRLEGNLRAIAAQKHTSDAHIPRIFHFISISDQPRELEFFTLMAIASALHYNPGWSVILHCTHEPIGANWERVKSRVDVNPIPHFDFFGIARIHHPAHRADVIRLLALKFVGGFYLDTDTLTIKTYEPLLKNKVVMAVQGALYDIPAGLCNATIAATRGATFIDRWLSKFKSFRSKGVDKYWDLHSVKMPALLSFYHPSEVTVLPFDSFFSPLWSDLERVVLEGDASSWIPHVQHSYVFHLWNGVTKHALAKISYDFIQSSRSLYAHFARPALELIG
jgi:hypothetical protein